MAVVERERERIAFVSAAYWDIELLSATAPAFTATLVSVDGARIASGKDFGDDGTVVTPGERLQFWPFSSEMLDEDLRAVGLEPETMSYAADVPNYVVTARRPR